MAYDISTSTYTQIALSVSAQSSVPFALLLSDDGTTLYVLDNSSADIYEYALSTAYDISTATYTQVALSVSGQDTSPTSLIYNGDGTKLYVSGYSGFSIYEYALSTAYDISTATYTQVALNTGTEGHAPSSLRFNGDGSVLYVLDGEGVDINEYALSAAHDISTASFTQIAISLSVNSSALASIIFNDTGTSLYVIDRTNSEIDEYTLSTPYDISTGSYTQVALDVVGQDTYPIDAVYNDTGSKLYVLGYGGDAVYEYALYYAAAEPDAKGVANLEITVENPHAKGVAWLNVVVSDTAKGVAQLQIDVEPPTARGVAQLAITVAGNAKGTAPIAVHVIDTTSPHWRAAVILDGVDITARITGAPRVSEAENSSTLLELDMLPTAGPFDPLAWVGQAITLDYVDCDPNGAERWRERQYTGVVSEPSHNPDTGIISLTCTNDLQGRFMGMTKSGIDLVVGGSYSPHVFDDQANNWQYAQDRLSTRTAFMWIDANGQLQAKDWTAKSTPDITVTDAYRIADSTRITRASKGQLVNNVRIDLDFRFERFKQRNVRYRFQWSDTICAYLKAQFPLPQKSMVESAANGGGWELLGGISYTDPWPPGAYSCGTSPTGSPDVRVWGYTNASALGIPDPELQNLCIGASFTLGQRWAQTVTETYSLTISAPNSVTGNGQRAEAQEYGIQADSEPSYWETDTNYRWSFDGSGATTSIAGAINKLPSGAVELSNGDWLYEASAAEKTGRSAMETAQLCVLDKTRVDILNRHRQNSVRFSVVYQPGIDMGMTARLLTPYVTATGVISEIERRFDTATGRPTLDITLAISRAGAVGVVTETPLETVDAPVSDPLTVYDRLVYMPFHIGGRIDSPTYNEDWDGVITNYDWDPTDLDPFATDPDNPQTVIYPESFRVNTQEISDADRQAISAQAAQIFEIDIPNDELTEVA